jgi:hypothetical protein
MSVYLLVDNNKQLFWLVAKAQFFFFEGELLCVRN